MEVDDTGARGRRGLLWFRLGFYPLALGIAVLLLWHGRASGDGDVTFLGGRTGQGEHISVTLHGSRPYALWTHVVDICPTGERRRFSWEPADGASVPFHVDGSRLRVDETSEEAWPGGIRGHIVVSLDGRLGGGRATGTLDSTETVDWNDGRTMTCSSGPVRFTAAAGRRRARG